MRAASGSICCLQVQIFLSGLLINLFQDPSIFYYLIMYLVTADILLFNYAFSYCNCVDYSVRFYTENYQKMILDFEKIGWKLFIRFTHFSLVFPLTHFVAMFVPRLFWCLYCWLRTYFTSVSIAFIVEFEQIIVNWGVILPLMQII